MKTLGEMFLRMVLPASDRRHVLDELDELFEIQRKRLGKEGAREHSWNYGVPARSSSHHAMLHCQT